MVEDLLPNNDLRPIAKIGDKVHRPTEFWQPAVHDLLNYLESVDFAYSPRVFNNDEQGREVLGYIDGESGKAGWTQIISDDGLRKYAKFLRAYHDAVAGYKPSDKFEWANGAKGLQPGQIICHGDFGPWNIVWKNGVPVGLVDWDLAHPNRPEHDILYALEYSAPFRDDETTIKWHHFKTVPDRKHRIEVFLEAYETPMINDIATKVAQMQREVNEFAKSLAKRGVRPQADWLANGDLDKADDQASWTEQHTDLF
jgi:thiamine kinase-like enzyme